MPRVLDTLDSRGDNQYETMYYDRFAEGQPDIIATKVLDVTDIVPKDVTQAVIKYASDSLGPLVIFQNRHKADEDSGMEVNFHLDEGLAERVDGYFMTYSWGLDPLNLIKIVVENLPR